MLGQVPDLGRVRAGAVLGGFEAEGGYNGPGQPANNWCWWEIERRAPRRSGAHFWPHWEAGVAAAAAGGCETVRVNIEWARCEPFDGQLDRSALAGYGRMLDCCHELGLQPVVSLHRFAHPAWMGVDFWLRPDSPERFRHWAETAVDHFAGRASQWATLDQLNVGALWAYLAGRNPPGRRLDVGATVRSLDHRLAAHVLAYEAIKERQPQAVVSTGNRSLPVYELDRLLVDVLLGRRAGVARHDLGSWLRERRSDFYRRRGAARTALTWVLRQWAGSAIPLEQALARSVAAVYGGPCERPIDLLDVGGHEDDLHQILPLPLPGAGRDGPPPLAAACRLHADVGLPLAVVDDEAADRAKQRENLAIVEAASGDGAQVVAFYQRLAVPRQAGTPVADRRVHIRATEPAAITI